MSLHLGFCVVVFRKGPRGVHFKLVYPPQKNLYVSAPRVICSPLVSHFVRVCSDFASELCDYGGAELEGGGTRRSEKVVWFDPLVSGCAGGACERARIGVMQKSRGRSFGRCVVVCVCAAHEGAAKYMQ